MGSLLNLATAHGILPGGGVFVQKIPLGVTVKRIQFIEGAPGSNPLYAVLVSREIETDLSNLNDDGLTQEEHQDILEEKENAKIKRQVEADLGGFDIEQEWVEEIERESCFKVDMKLGGAPPIQKSAYSLWIVDAASGWVVVDTYEFEEYEHAISMQVMYLSEVRAESVVVVDRQETNTHHFVTVPSSWRSPAQQMILLFRTKIWRVDLSLLSALRQ
jgi:cleavage and polyadenylation specificity factor subunit 1